MLHSDSQIIATDSIPHCQRSSKLQPSKSCPIQYSNTFPNHCMKNTAKFPKRTISHPKYPPIDLTEFLHGNRHHEVESPAAQSQPYFASYLLFFSGESVCQITLHIPFLFPFLITATRDSSRKRDFGFPDIFFFVSFHRKLSEIPSSRHG